MKKSVIVYMIIIAACVGSLTASAQDRLKMELGYNVSVPAGSFKNDFISNTSFRGVTGELSYTINRKFSVGLHAGYQSFYQKYDRQTYKLEGNQTVSAVVTNTMDLMPVLLRGTYFPMGEDATAKVQPYLSAGAGVNLVTYGQYLGQFGGNQTSSPFAVQGGAGVRIPLTKIPGGTAFKVGATYNYVNYNDNNISKLNNIGLNAGVVFRLR